MRDDYVHGYSNTESSRLTDQAQTLAERLHHDTKYPEGSRVLEAGCGTGAQTVILAKNSPGARITSCDISELSLEEAERKVREEGFDGIQFKQGDVYRLPFEEEVFDHVFVCFVLEHLARPLDALAELKRVVRPGGTITLIEGDHGSFYCYPETEEARQTVQCLIDVQAALGGNALVGRELYPLMKGAGLMDIIVTPRIVYVDPSRPEWEEGFSQNTFIAMVEGVENEALERGMISRENWDKGIRDLYATVGKGTFHYSFFKGVGKKSLR
jgi:ubiquinone/menaquinone biosynthesis C-methylase UbiE